MVALVFALASALAGGMNLWPRRAVPYLTDEGAYLLQARTFAQLRLTLPAPALPEFFETAQVLVTPRYQAKYPPGHALALAPFAALGVAWLWPLLAFGGCAALVYLAVRQLGASPLLAAFGAALFATSTINLAMLPSYLSHCTSTLAGLGALLLTARAARLRTARAAALAGSFAALAFLARPYPGLACFAAAALVLVRAGAGRRALLGLAASLLACVALSAAFDAATTGSWSLPPWTLYAAQYTPFDGPGVGPVHPLPPARPLPAHLRPLFEEYQRSRLAYGWSKLFAQVPARLAELIQLLPLRAVAVLALLAPAVALAPQATFAWTWLLVLFALQLSFHASLPQYFLDEYAPLVVLVAAGLHAALAGRQRAARVLGALVAVQLAFFSTLYEGGVFAAACLIALGLALAATALRRELPQGWPDAALRGLAAALAAAACVQMPFSAARSRVVWERGNEVRLRFAARMEELRNRRALVFVRGTPAELVQLAIIDAEPDPRPLLAVDLGARDAELIALHPDREPLLFEVGSGSLTRLGRAPPIR